VKRILRIAGLTLVFASIVVFGFLAYQLFVTDLLNARSQQQAAGQLVSVMDQRRREVGAGPSLPDRPEVPVLMTEPPPTEGQPFGRLLVPRLAVDEVLFEGVDRQTLKLGPGHMPGTALPGHPGNAVISGHRTTYGRPFQDFDQLELGDRIEVETAVGMSVYEVRQILIVEPTALWVVDDRPGGWLTLTTCHPRFSAAQRLVIQAEMVAGPNQAYIQATEKAA
jgi:sortase A